MWLGQDSTKKLSSSNYLTQIMCSKVTRKELVVIGWIRASIGSLPIDLSKLIQLFSVDEILWNVEGCKLTNIAQSSKAVDEITFIVEGITFLLSVAKGKIHALDFSLCVNRSLLWRKTMNIKGNISIEGNTNNFVFDITAIHNYENILKRKMFSISKDVLNEYDELNMICSIVIEEITYYHRQIEDDIEWKLDRYQLDILKEGTSMISAEVNDWRLSIAPVGGEGHRELSLRLSDNLPWDLWDISALQVRLKLIIKSNEKYLQMEDVKKLDEYGGLIHGWDQTQFGDRSEFVVTLKIKIEQIYLDEDDEDILNESKWNDYGFVQRWY